MAWDLRYPSPNVVQSTSIPKKEPTGMMVPPGEYSATLIKVIDGESVELSVPQTFKVKQLKKGSLDESSPDATAAFWRELEEINLTLSHTSTVIQENQQKVARMKVALGLSQSVPGKLDQELHDLANKLYLMNKQLNGDPLRNEVGEKSNLTIGDRVSVASMGTGYSTYGPTAMHKQSLAIANKQLAALRTELEKIREIELPALEQSMKEVKAPYVKGME